MTRKMTWIVMLGVALWSCGGGEAGEESAPAAERQTAASEAPTTESGGFTRDSFILCPALEDHQEELAGIVGFERDAERGLQVLGNECIVRGEDAGFARVTLVPAFTRRSIQMYIGGFDAETSPAAELGPDALFVHSNLQPHVVFPMGELIIDVEAENLEAPSRETMIELARRVREILTEANS